MPLFQRKSAITQPSEKEERTPRMVRTSPSPLRSRSTSRSKILATTHKRKNIWGKKRIAFIFGLLLGLSVLFLPSKQSIPPQLAEYLAAQFAHTETPGRKLKLHTKIKPKHPVFLIPGIVSTGLESWSADECAASYFRKRVWGEMTMGKMMLMDKECWLKHLMLMPNGFDPKNVKLRAAQGLDAADYLIGPYWVWAKMIENLGDIGYDNNNLHMASYDWRLSVKNLEKRDRYFTKLKRNIELSFDISGEKCVIVAHSMGSNVILWFMKWVESQKGGQGGTRWVDKYIESVVNVGGPMLGLPKTIASSLSGEMRDTAQLGKVMTYFLELFYSKNERAGLFRSWLGALSMLPKGGNAIWGDTNSAPDDVDIFGTNSTSDSLGSIIKYRAQSASGNVTAFNVTVRELADLIGQSGGTRFHKRLNDEFDFGILDPEQLKSDPSYYDNQRYWTNPLTMQLPHAPDMKIYCIYGTGKDTERAYYYTGSDEASTSTSSSIQTPVHPNDGMPNDDDDEHEPWPPAPPKLAFQIDTDYNRASAKVENGVQDTDGDGTVPLLSLGYMCVEGWKKKEFNPANIKIITREILHQPVSLVSDVRGGPNTSDHVDILGNHKLTEDVLRIVSNDTTELHDSIISKIKEIVQGVKLWKDDTVITKR